MRYLVLSVLMAGCSVVWADDATLQRIEQKIDTISTRQKTEFNDPLADKRWGIEISPLRLIDWHEGEDEERDEFAGTISYFPANQRAEIAFPFFLGNLQDKSEDEHLKSRTIDAHYRYFLGRSRAGMYLAGFGRLAFLSGTLGDDIFDANEVDENGHNKEDKTTKFGLGIGIGQRFFSPSGLYWGWSVILGRYISGESNRYAGDFFILDDDEKVILDAELMKVGWAF
jgi:hypothetical protein